MSDASPLEQARRQIAADLEETQGPWRRRPLLLRAALLVVPAVVVVGAAFVLLDPGRAVLSAGAPAVVVAGVAALLGLIGVALAPERPALGERVAQLATVVAVAAFVAEVTRMDPVAHPGGGLGSCLTSTGVVGAAAAVVVGAALWSSRLPLRLWHKIGLGVASILGACAAIWHHCPSAAVAHVLVAHTLGPVALLAAVVVVMGRLRR